MVVETRRKSYHQHSIINTVTQEMMIAPRRRLLNQPLNYSPLVYKKYTLKEPDSRLRPIELSGCKIKLDLDSGLERPTAIILIVHQPDAKPSKLDSAARLTVVKGIIRPV